jgi:hypothetical protein
MIIDQIPRPTFIHASLEWLIESSGIRLSPADRRLNAIENQLANLVRRWHPFRPMNPAIYLQMCETTRERLLVWVEERGAPVGETRSRFEVYASPAVINPSVPAGWIRFLL